MNLIKKFYNWLLITLGIRKQLPITPLSEVFTVTAPKPAMTMRGTRKPKKHGKTNYTRNGTPKHPLHKYHFGSFRPVKGL
jgi:hypothetical protein